MVADDDGGLDIDLLNRALEEQLDELLERLVPRVAAELDRLRPPLPLARSEQLVDVHAVAAYLGIGEQWVSAHAVELRARLLGTRTLRFSLAEVDGVLLQKAVDRG